MADATEAKKKFVRGADKKAPLPKPWALFTQALRDYRAHWWLFTAIILIVALPSAILSNFFDPAGDTILTAYVTFAQFAMDVAVVFAVVALLRDRTVGVRQAYYESSAVLVRAILVWVLLLVMSLLLIIGLAILLYGVVTPGTGLSLTEQLLLILLAAAVSIPSVVLLTRGVWALYVVYETPQGPWQALKTSRQLTKGRVLASLGRLLALIPFLLLVLLVPVLVLAGLQTLTHWLIITVLLQVAISLIVLPLTSFYLYRYYLALK